MGACLRLFSRNYYRDAEQAMVPPSSNTRVSEEANQLKKKTIDIYKVSMRPDLAEPSYKIHGISGHPSYHGAMNSEDAKKKLQEHGGNCYLTRYSESQERYFLTVIRVNDEGEDPVFGNFAINISKGKDNVTTWYEIEKTERQFRDLFELLESFKKSAVSHSIAGIGEHIRWEGYSTPPPGFVSDLSTVLEQDEIDFVKTDTKASLFSNTSVDMSTPSLATLSLIKWADEKGNTNKFELLEKISSKWWKAGTLLGLHIDQLENFEQKTKENSVRFGYVFAHWESEGHPAYPFTWEGLLELLADIGKTEEADKLKKVLEDIGLTFGDLS